MIYLGLYNLLMLIRYWVSAFAPNRYKIYWALLVALFLFSAFRFEVGCDWTGYLNQYEIQRYATLEEAMAMAEPLWWTIIEFTHRKNLPYPWLNVISSAFFFIGIHAMAQRQHDPLGFLVLLFPILIINMPMSGIRQGAAIGVLCLAYVAFIDERRIRFIGWVLLASTLHTSALMMIALVPLIGGVYSWRRLVLMGALAIPGMAFMLQGESAQIAISRYLNTGVDAAGGIFRAGILVISGACFLIYLQVDWAKRFPKDYNLAIIGALMMVSIILLFPISSVIGDRFGYFLTPIQAMILARLPYLPIGRAHPSVIALPYIGLAVVFLTWTSLSSHFQLCYLPYQTWIFGFPSASKFIN